MESKPASIEVIFMGALATVIACESPCSENLSDWPTGKEHGKRTGSNEGLPRTSSREAVKVLTDCKNISTVGFGAPQPTSSISQILETLGAADCP
jgi:hypothetical protein